jgi:hypothetical protein
VALTAGVQAFAGSFLPGNPEGNPGLEFAPVFGVIALGDYILKRGRI